MDPQLNRRPKQHQKPDPYESISIIVLQILSQALRNLIGMPFPNTFGGEEKGIPVAIHSNHSDKCNVVEVLGG